MAEDATDARGTGTSGRGSVSLTARETRQKALLKTNMGRRKAQKRARSEEDADRGETPEAAGE